MQNALKSRRGMVVAPHALASQAALAVLREGGNAVEAMVAAAAMISVAYPHMNSIGGDSFWLISMPGSGPDPEVIAIDGSGAASLNANLSMYEGRSAIPFRGGAAAITTAGTVSAWKAALDISSRRLAGKCPLERLLCDAIDGAANGIPVTDSQCRSTTAKRSELSHVPGFSGVFLNDGAAPAAGSILKQPKLAATFRHLARAGLDDFYRGELAASIAADLRAAGSPVDGNDLKAHQAMMKTPLVLEHSAGRIYNTPPSTQGLVSLLILGMMDRLGIAKHSHLSAAFIHRAVESAKQAFEVRDTELTDIDFMRNKDVQSWLSASSLDAMTATISETSASPWGAGRGPGDTVWMGVIDGEGNAVSMIQSIYHEFGSGIVLKESGITWQNRGASFSLTPAHINCLVPGKRPFHTLNPALAHLNDGRTMVYGNMGGDGQPQSQSAVFNRVVTYGMNPQAAISAPRWLLGRTWGNASETLKLEGHFPPGVDDALRALGHDVEVYPAFDETFGHAGCIIRHPEGVFEGGFDVRSDGSVAAY
jgi:gamma-glutamyltranspeptidase/glutathione hydrolase